MIEHTVTFQLIHPSGSPEEAEFLSSADALKTIPGVQDFKIQRQVSEKHPHPFRITMKFATQADYSSYDAHPQHQAFVKDRWLKEVSEFQEADFVDF